MDFKDQLVTIARTLYSADDPSHDFQHVLRVLNNAIKLVELEGGDLDIVIPAVIFHDVISYAKNDPRAPLSTEESAKKAAEILNSIENYPKEKIENVAYAIRVCSFTKNIKAETFESKILQDADMLESVGAISIMRSFASAGQMNRRLYDPEDPFGDNREFNDMKNTLDIFYSRLLKVPDRMNTPTAKNVALKRVDILKNFAEQVRVELNQSDF